MKLFCNGTYTKPHAIFIHVCIPIVYKGCCSWNYKKRGMLEQLTYISLDCLHSLGNYISKKKNSKAMEIFSVQSSITELFGIVWLALTTLKTVQNISRVNVWCQFSYWNKHKTIKNKATWKKIQSRQASFSATGIQKSCPRRLALPMCLRLEWNYNTSWREAYTGWLTTALSLKFWCYKSMN